MRGALCLLMVLGCATAVAQDARGGIDLAGVVALRGVVEETREDSCSRSHGHGSTRAEVTLRVDAGGAAEVGIDVHTHDSIVSLSGSPMRSRSSVTQSQARVLLRGTARRERGALVIRFAELERAYALWLGIGTLPLPAATRTPHSGSMRCESAHVDVLPAQASAGEQAAREALARCTMTPWPDDLPRARSVLLGTALGVRVVRARGDDAAGEEVRRAVE